MYTSIHGEFILDIFCERCGKFSHFAYCYCEKCGRDLLCKECWEFFGTRNYFKDISRHSNFSKYHKHEKLTSLDVI